MKKYIPFLLSLFLLTGCAGNTAKDMGYRQITTKEAVNIPNESIGSEEISELPDKDQLIFVYCRSGNRSKQASEKLADLGYTNIVEFGGINDWTGETVSE